jgi:hypothetical protein
MSEQKLNIIKTEAIMAFANMHVGAFDAGFVEGNTLTVYDVHRSAQNYVRDTFQVNVRSLAETWGNDTAVDCRASEFKWNNPEDVPVIKEGTEKEIWLAVEIDSPKFEKPKKITFLAQYQNRPYKEGDEGLHGDDALVNTDGEYVNSVGWVTCQSHCEFDNYYELITFNENYKLLGWAEYTSPKFP